MKGQRTPPTVRERVSDALTVVIAVCALVVTGLAVRNQLAPSSARAAAPVTAEMKELMKAGHWMGSRQAPLVMVEFSDFQCPFCSQAARTVQDFRAANPGQVTVLYRHFPLEAIHPHADAAARASFCAGRQGLFDAYHDILFQNQDSIGKTPWETFARRVGVPDPATFRACLQDEASRRAVAADLQAAKRLGLTATPVFIVNGRVHTGAPSTEQLQGWLDEARR